jgi:hypothetical protein
MALPVAVFTTCQVRGEYVFSPGEEWTIKKAVMYRAGSVGIGLAVGVVLVVALVWMAVRLRRRGPGDGSGAGPAGPAGGG